MDDLDVLARDFGFGARQKSNPMRSHAGDLRSSSVSRFDGHSNRDDDLFSDVFGGPPKYTNTTTSINNKSSSVNDFDYNSIFKSEPVPRDSESSNENAGKTSSLPVYDKPMYDEDIFDGLPGLKSKSPHQDDVFVSMASPPRQQNNNSTADHFNDLLGNLGSNHRSNNKNSEAFDDLLDNFGKKDRVMDGSKSGRSSTSKVFDDLLGDFGSGSSASGHRSASHSNHGQKSAGNANQSKSNMVDDPFIGLETTSPQVSSSEAVPADPLEEIGKLQKFRNSKTDSSSSSGGVFDDLDPLNRFRKSAVPSPDIRSRENDGSPYRSGPSTSGTQAPANSEHVEKSSFGYPESDPQAKVQDDNFQESPMFDIPTADSQRSFNRSDFSSPYTNANINETDFHGGMSPGAEHLQPSDDAWLTVSEIPLYTQPTRAPPPSRSPPPIPRKMSKKESNFPPSDFLKNRGGDFASPPGYTSYSEIPKPGRSVANNISRSQIDELEDFAMGSTKNTMEDASTPLGEEMNASSVAAAAMKEAMDKAEAKFRHAKEVREREYAKAAKTKESIHVDQNEDGMSNAEEREFQEIQEGFDREKQRREEEQREDRRLEKERERAREIEREKARQAVERATREARERAGAEARLRAERAAVEKVQNEARERAERVAVGKVQNEARERAERAAVEKVQNEARERAERASVLRAQAEARERAAAEARERQEKAAAEAREREAREKATEARRRAERNAVERAAAEARERAAAEARDRAAASRANQQKNDNDVESFFKMDSRASSVPKARDNSYDSIFDPPPFKGPGGAQGSKTTSVGSSPNNNMSRPSSSTNIVDDLSSIFGVAQAGEFQEAEGETEERRKARLERHQRTQERAAKALAEKNQRDINAQREQEERHRIGETLDLEIKRWAAGKEGNLRALLSTLQYVLWPECGWQPISLTDLIVGANVKKAYRKATLCIHPDKVQQKGATLQQKYIAGKVFDLLKEAWNKFNSEELF